MDLSFEVEIVERDGETYHQREGHPADRRKVPKIEGQQHDKGECDGDQAEVVGGDLRLPGVSRDPKDNPLVACATEGAADYLVSGDADLLALGKHENTTMVSPREFVEILGL
jgi:hypothetical protein